MSLLVRILSVPLEAALRELSRPDPPAGAGSGPSGAQHWGLGEEPRPSGAGDRPEIRGEGAASVSSGHPHFQEDVLHEGPSAPDWDLTPDPTPGPDSAVHLRVHRPNKRVVAKRRGRETAHAVVTQHPATTRQRADNAGALGGASDGWTLGAGAFTL